MAECETFNVRRLGMCKATLDERGECPQQGEHGDEFDVKEGGKPDKVCPLCKQRGGPYPNGDRPKSANPLRSGCPRCGWCY